MRSTTPVALLVALATMVPRTGRAAEPTVAECVTASNASVGLRGEHRLRAARAQLLVCVAAACPAEVRAECSRRLDEVGTAMPTVVFIAHDGNGRELSDVRVTVDGEVVAQHLDGGAVVLDPGQHQVTFEASGQTLRSRTIVVHEGERDRREVLAFEAAPAPSPPTYVEPAAPAGGIANTPPAAGNTGHVLGVVAGAAGIAGLATGILFGALTFSSWGTANRECPTHSGCSVQAVQARTSALDFATVSNITFVAGGALLLGGVTLYLTAPKGPGPAVGVGLDGLSLRGAF